MMSVIFNKKIKSLKKQMKMKKKAEERKREKVSFQKIQIKNTNRYYMNI